MTIHTSVSMLSKSYVFDPRPRIPFRIAAKRYWIGECPDATSKIGEHPDAITLVLVTGHAAHKEQWEPTIQRLLQNYWQQHEATPQRVVRFHDIWSLDLPNLGDSAILNEEILRTDEYSSMFSWEYHARAIHAFLAGLGSGVDVDFSKRRLALSGHSMGGTAIILTATYFPLLNISSLHLVEPFMTPGSAQGFFLPISETSDRRRDIWPSVEEAYRSLKVRSIMCTWDERVLRIFIDHGLRPLPTAEYPDLTEGVTLKCARKQEAATYRDYVTSVTAFGYLAYILKEIPTHIILGEFADYVTVGLHEDVLHDASGGISNFASVTRVAEAGHMVVQTHPDALGDAIWNSLTQPPKRSRGDRVSAKL